MFRFSIRELMLITLVVGLTVGWWIDHRQNTSTLKKFIQEQEARERNWRQPIMKGNINGQA